MDLPWMDNHRIRLPPGLVMIHIRQSGNFDIDGKLPSSSCAIDKSYDLTTMPDEDNVLTVVTLKRTEHYFECHRCWGYTGATFPDEIALSSSFPTAM